MTSLLVSFLLLPSVTGSLGQGVSRPCSQSNLMCRLPMDPGPCLAYYPRYYFDANQGACKMFIYGGCRGNGNNFASLEECQASCQDSRSICELPKAIGPCKARILRYFYNAQSGQCERFYYGGCGGNYNNFDSIQQCYQHCPCQQSNPRVCSLAVEPGPCRGSIIRYFYDVISGKCKRFIYGGCRGNANNFDSIKKCEATCQPYVQAEKPSEGAESGVCLLPKKPGPCRGAFHRFFYNKSTGKCETFIYGGCKGNANNFESIEKCRSKCTAQSVRPKKCLLPKKTGPCRGSFRRYFFNTRTQRCEQFTYGGCSGNANNFRSMRECQNTCNA